jgi:hypothetical protein
LTLDRTKGHNGYEKQNKHHFTDGPAPLFHVDEIVKALDHAGDPGDAVRATSAAAGATQAIPAESVNVATDYASVVARHVLEQSTRNSLRSYRFAKNAGGTLSESENRVAGQFGHPEGRGLRTLADSGPTAINDRRLSANCGLTKGVLTGPAFLPVTT